MADDLTEFRLKALEEDHALMRNYVDRVTVGRTELERDYPTRAELAEHQAANQGTLMTRMAVTAAFLSALGSLGAVIVTVIR